MEKRVKQEKKYKYVEDGMKDVVVFVSLDGKEWKTEKECFEQDASILRKQKQNEILKINDVWILESPCVWYFPKTEEELEIVKQVLGYYDRHKEVSGQLDINMWIGGLIEYGGDHYPDRHIIMTLDQYKKEIDEFLSKFEIK